MSISSIKEMAIGLNYNHFKNEQNWNISDYDDFREGKDGKLHNDALNIISPRISRQRLGAILKTGRLNFIKEESGKILISVRSLLKENKRRETLSKRLLSVNKAKK